MKQVLHVGCGPANPHKLHKTFQGKEWREVRLDIDPNAKPDIVASMTDMSVVQDESMDAVWSSHNLEHLYPHEVSVALKEFRRVLKPSGFLLLTLPDLRQVAQLVAEDKLDEPAYLSPAGPIAPLDILYGHRPSLARGNLFMAHRTGFTASTLENSLVAAGFSDVKVESDQNFNLWAMARKNSSAKAKPSRGARILFIHQNFPGQFRNIAAHWGANPENHIVAISQKRAPGLEGVRNIQYEPARVPTQGIHHYLGSAEAGVLNGQAVVRILMRLRDEGFVPDIVIGHAGWGETLYVKDVFPNTRLVNYLEFFYHATGADTDFDPEYPNHVDDIMRIRTKNVINLLALDGCDVGISPTMWQRSLHPAEYQSKIQVIHEGINTSLAQPNPEAKLELPNGLVLGPDDEVVTYVARNLEPYRGFHTFMRAAQEICRRRPKTHLVVIGGDGVSYGRKLRDGLTYRQKMLSEVSIDPERVHFLGQVPYATYLSALQVSSAHVYLTVPFVLSWSLLEAMATGALIIGSDTPPVREVIQDGKTGFLVDFFSPSKIADLVDHALDNRDQVRPMRTAAHNYVIENFNYQGAIQNYTDLVRKVTGVDIT